MARRKKIPARKLCDAHHHRMSQGPSNSWSWSSRGLVFTTRRSARLLVQVQSTKKKHDEVIATSKIGTGVASSASSSRIIDSQARPLLICTGEVTWPIHDDPYIKFERYTPGKCAEFIRMKANELRLLVKKKLFVGDFCVDY